MKHLLALAFALAVSTGASAQLYKWVDKDGRVSYSDRPPPEQKAQQLNVAPGPPAAPPRSNLERDKALEKTRAGEREKAKVAAEAASRAKQDEEACERARMALRNLTEGGRFATIDAKGERVLLDEKQIEAETDRARKAVEKFCKST